MDLWQDPLEAPEQRNIMPEECTPVMWTSAGSEKLQAPLDKADTSQPHARPQFSPYDFNGGTAAAIAGDDWVVIASDTRLSRGFSILSRDVSKMCQISDRCVVATGGCWTDVSALHKRMGMSARMYKYDHNMPMSTHAFAQHLSNTLYYRRFFPFYAFNVVGGLDDEGKGAVYTYDAVGSFQRVDYAVQGAGQQQMIPLMDNIVGNKNRSTPKQNFQVTDAVNMIKEGFVSAGERSFFVGDAVEILIITKDGTRKERFQLKAD